MLTEILMEALMSMDDDTLDSVLESCDTEELEIIDSAIETISSDGKHHWTQYGSPNWARKSNELEYKLKERRKNLIKKYNPDRKLRMGEDDPTWVEPQARDRLKQINDTLKKINVGYENPQTPGQRKFNNIKRDGRCFSVSATNQLNKQRFRNTRDIKNMIGNHMYDEQKMGYESEKYDK